MSSGFLPGPDAGAINTRQLNRQRLLEAIRRLGPMSRADLAKTTRLSPPTISSLVDNLVGEAGLLREVGIGVSSGGRPPILLEFNAEYGRLVGVDIGSRTLRFALADLQGRILARRHERTRTASCVETIDQVLAGIDRLLSDHGQDPAKLFAIGIGAPGTTDVTTGRVITAANLSGWIDVPLQHLVEERFQAAVRVDNDANMAALGERWQGAARQVNDFVFVALGAGVGAGVVLGGRLHRGHHSHGGEISHMTLDFRDWHVDFGARGYLESRIGAAAIPRWEQAQSIVARSGQDPDAAMRAIFTLARQGDRDAAALVDDLGVLLGTAVANIVAVLDPQLIVFGGGVAQAGDLLLAPVRRVVSRIVRRVPALQISSLGEDAQLLGSVYSAMEVAEARIFAIAATASGSRESRTLTAQ